MISDISNFLSPLFYFVYMGGQGVVKQVVDVLFYCPSPTQFQIYKEAMPVGVFCCGQDPSAHSAAMLSHYVFLLHKDFIEKIQNTNLACTVTAR